MKYKKFIINNYRAISSPLEIEVQKRRLTPIIGINECGKSTILQAIFAFDYFNDHLNGDGKHLKDIANLYSIESKSIEVSAEIEISNAEITEIINDLIQKLETEPESIISIIPVSYT
ncbi:MAG: AAA family ATPase, partial [Xenococcus sp. (in: cyanobacteria)]